ncbi:MAG: hypothetical protein JWM11_6688, partial [Planctomycetaceae bacterium]|nr:hypothetical protein [Planctomycetaceae bacterium]
MRNTLFLALLLIFSASILPRPRAIHGCAVAPRHDDSVEVNSEEAIILYDAKSHTEHF